VVSALPSLSVSSFSLPFVPPPRASDGLRLETAAVIPAGQRAKKEANNRGERSEDAVKASAGGMARKGDRERDGVGEEESRGGRA